LCHRDQWDVRMSELGYQRSFGEDGLTVQIQASRQEASYWRKRYEELKAEVIENGIVLVCQVALCSSPTSDNRSHF
jgi:hypothetical protein